MESIVGFWLWRWQFNCLFLSFLSNFYYQLFSQFNFYQTQVSHNGLYSVQMKSFVSNLLGPVTKEENFFKCVPKASFFSSYLIFVSFYTTALFLPIKSKCLFVGLVQSSLPSIGDVSKLFRNWVHYIWCLKVKLCIHVPIFLLSPLR